MRTLAAAVLIALGGGCQTPLRSISEDDLIARKATLLGAAQAEIQRFEASGERRIETEYRAALAAPGAPPQSYDVLILSGGGAFGAFGAGFLDGWGSVSDPEFARPHFDKVSGISTGALIAPYAFIGSPAAYETLVAEYQNPGSDWVRRRGLIPFLPGNVSLYDVSELRRHIRDAVTPELVAGLAEGGDEDRALIVGATNVDYGILRVWDVARIARDSPVEDAVDEIASILTASSAIPGAFPPVEIDDLLYVDGAAAMQVVGGLEDRSWLYAPGGQSPGFGLEGPPVRIRAWIIVNQKLRPDPKVARSRWTSIATRSLEILLRTSMLQSIQDGETYAALLDSRPDLDVVLRYVAIPQDFEVPDSDQMFDARTMRALIELGRQMGADPRSWRTEALRPGAPFRKD
jgi:hypothetical protein